MAAPQGRVVIPNTVDADFYGAHHTDAADVDADGDLVYSSARHLQYRVTVTRQEPGVSPLLRKVGTEIGAASRR